MQREDTLMPDSADVKEQVYSKAKKLKEVLNREYRALLDKDIELINELASEKEVLLMSLAQLEPQLITEYNKITIFEGEQSVQQLLESCRELNERNHSLVLIAIDQNRKSLSLLRSILKLDQVSEYSASGELNADRSKRYLGNA